MRPLRAYGVTFRVMHGYSSTTGVDQIAEESWRSLPSFSLEEKRLDPRYRWFKERDRATCWELDAIPLTLR